MKKIGLLAGMIFLLLPAFQEAKADEAAIYVESPLPFRTITSFAHNEESFNGRPHGGTFGFLVPVSTEKSTIVLDVAFSNTIITDLNFASATTTKNDYSRRYDLERVQLSTVEIGGRGYPSGAGIALIIGWGEWEAKDRETGSTKRRDFGTSLGVKLGGNFPIGDDFLVLINGRFFFDPAISLLSLGLGYRF